MTSSSTRLSFGTAAWLRALIIGVLLALAIPAFAAGAEPAEGSTAVADPPAAQVQEPAETAGPTEPAPVAPSSAFEPAPELAPTPAPEPAAVEPAAVEPAPTPTPAPAPPPSSGTEPATPSSPVVEETPVPVPTATPPLAELLPVVAPLLPELTPTLPTIPDVPRDRPAPLPAVPAVVSPATDIVDRSTALPVAPPASPRVVAPVPTATLGGPTTPVKSTPAAAPDTGSPLADTTIQKAGFTNLISLERGADAAASPAPTPRTEGPADFGPAAPQPGDNPFVVSLEAQSGPAPVGSSLLAVLAGYVLPGSGSLPLQTTLFLFVQLAVILAFALAPRPGTGERLVLWGLLRSQAGHRLAVRRPG